MAINPERLSRDAVRLVDRVETQTVRRIMELLALVERDAKERLALLDLSDSDTARAIKELRAREAMQQSRAAQILLGLGSDGGSVSREVREGVALAYRDGIRSATENVQALGLTTSQEAAVLAMGTRVDLDLIEAMTRTTLTTLNKVGEQGLRRMEEAVVRGAVRGAGPRATGRLIRESVDLTRYEGERIARTVFMRANNEARESTFKEMNVQYVIYDATNDHVTCAFCEARHGMVYEIREAPDVPIHPHCLVGDTVVLAEGVTGYSKRWYEGPIVTITTRMGNRLTVTPNHPILTPIGWVNAGVLNVGSNIISRAAGDGVRAGLLNDEDVHGRVEDVVNTLAESFEMSARPVPVSAEHFHGDGVGSEVAVVGANRELWDGYDSAIKQQVMKYAFMLTIESAFSRFRSRSRYQAASGLLGAAYGGVCGAHLPFALLLGHLSPLDAFGFGLIPRLNPVVTQTPINDVAAHAEMFRESVDASSVFESFDEVANREVVNTMVNEHASVFQHASNRVMVTSGDGANLAGVLTGEVETDEVVALSVREWSGHVYNLQTTRGYYVADGIITHNCRCVLLPWREESDFRADDYYENTRKEMRERREAEDRKGTTATARAPFERMDEVDPPKPVWAPGRGWLS